MICMLVNIQRWLSISSTTIKLRIWLLDEFFNIPADIQATDTDYRTAECLANKLPFSTYILLLQFILTKGLL